MSTLRTTTISNVAGSSSVPVDTVINGSAKAWVNFNGTGTVAIRAAFNVSSITDNGTGDYTVNFATAMPDGDYVVAGEAQNQTGTNWREAIQFFSAGYTAVPPTTTGFRLQTLTAGFGAYYDPSIVTLSVFR